MPDPLSNAIEGAATETVKGIIQKAGNDRWSNNMMSFMMLSALMAGGFLWFFCVAKPQSDVQIETVRSTNESNKLNAETNKLNAETNKANIETNQRMSTAIDRMSASVETINSHLLKSSERMGTVVEKLQSTEDTQSKTLEKIANAMNREPAKAGGG